VAKAGRKQRVNRRKKGEKGASPKNLRKTITLACDRGYGSGIWLAN
jgi:hypothetical protein